MSALPLCMRAREVYLSPGDGEIFNLSKNFELPLLESMIPLSALASVVVQSASWVSSQE